MWASSHSELPPMWIQPRNHTLSKKKRRTLCEPDSSQSPDPTGATAIPARALLFSSSQSLFNRRWILVGPEVEPELVGPSSNLGGVRALFLLVSGRPPCSGTGLPPIRLCRVASLVCWRSGESNSSIPLLGRYWERRSAG